MLESYGLGITSYSFVTTIGFALFSAHQTEQYQNANMPTNQHSDIYIIHMQAGAMSGKPSLFNFRNLRNYKGRNIPK